jgi:hypothetical protein
MARNSSLISMTFFGVMPAHKKLWEEGLYGMGLYPKQEVTDQSEFDMMYEDRQYISPWAPHYNLVTQEDFCMYCLFFALLFADDTDNLLQEIIYV